MKILQIVKTSEGAKWAYDQVVALKARGVDVITVLPDGNGAVAKLYEQTGVPTIIYDLSLPIRAPWKIFSRIKAFRKIVKEQKPDIIHSHFVTTTLMMRIALIGISIPRVFQVPGPLHLESAVYRKAEIMLANKNDYWIGTCKKTCSLYRASNIDEDRVFLGYYGGYGGVVCDTYYTHNDKLHKEFCIPEDRLVVGMVSYFYKQKKYAHQKRGIKGHEDFIDAISIVRKKYPNTIGLIIGGPWGKAEDYVEKIKNYAQENCPEGIIFTGFRDDVKEIYCEIDIAVHPSHSENLGGAAESLAAGIPTISTNVGGFPDIVINGKTGLTVPKESPKELADAIIKMLENSQEAKTMANKGRELVRNLLDVESCADTVKEIYNQILNQRIGR